MTHTADVKVESPSCTAERKALDSGLEPHGQELATMLGGGKYVYCKSQGNLEIRVPGREGWSLPPRPEK